eukprot:758708-Hanusia_phi.AAC.5
MSRRGKDASNGWMEKCGNQGTCVRGRIVARGRRECLGKEEMKSRPVGRERICISCGQVESWKQCQVSSLSTPGAVH